MPTSTFFFGEQGVGVEFQTGSPGRPGTHSVDQTGLLLPHEYWA